MHPAIRIVSEPPRGCGRRKAGGLYLRSDGPARGCGKLPIPLAVCPCCGEGIRPSRAPRLLEEPWRLWEVLPCKEGRCTACPLNAGSAIGSALLVWVGEKHYPTPAAFEQESDLMGISRRIPSVPRGFRVGETWVLLAHRKAIQRQSIRLGQNGSGQTAFTGEPEYTPGIFRVFKPDRIEVVVTGEETDAEIEGYLARGLTPVLIQAAPEPPSPPEPLPMFEGLAS